MRTLGSPLRSHDGAFRVSADPSSALEPFPLIGIQRAYWVGQRVGDPSSGVGGLNPHIYAEYELGGAVSPPLLGVAIDALVLRHPMLRSVLAADATQTPARRARLERSPSALSLPTPRLTTQVVTEDGRMRCLDAASVPRYAVGPNPKLKPSPSPDPNVASVPCFVVASLSEPAHAALRSHAQDARLIH